MSLYDGLDIDKEGGGNSGTNVAGWSSGYKLLKSQLKQKKASVLQPKKPTKQSIIMAPVVDLKRQTDSAEGPLHFNLQTGRLERMVGVAPVAVGGGSPFIPSEPIPSLTGVIDEYNPLIPNDYEEIAKKRKEQRQKEREEDDRRKKRDRERTERSERSERADRERDSGLGEMDRARRRREEEEEEYDRPAKRKPDRGAGAAIAPPTSLLEEAVVVSDADRSRSPTNQDYGGNTAGGSVASKIMAKYGYKEGQGLGKLEQGMSTALYVEKTSKRGGKIIHERDMPKDTPKEPATNTNLLKNPTKVVLLRNMVGPGEVDEDLEPETFEECGKYGKVIKCLIFEMPGVTEDEAVRIFVEFDRIDAAIKAIIDLNGRFFGGRVVKACFYNLDKFRRLDLADDPDA